ncbi:hypothetical protein CEXT_577271 [Caerostris extrusa]|uniref:Uncharacterized protein n=1 Tax=Caerostris extrusa TaxID=172846 RepID=A0AAV4PL67_CAEEX|nr:hypothetical protein CEXT_577271 [Caerostris extrusa]
MLPLREQCFHAVLHSSERSFWKEWVERAEGGQRPLNPLTRSPGDVNGGLFFLYHLTNWAACSIESSKNAN